MKLYYDDRGRYRGHSEGLGLGCLRFFFGVFVLALLIGWPLLIHGPIGLALEAVWVVVTVPFAMILFAAHTGSRAAPRPPRDRQKPHPGLPKDDPWPAHGWYEWQKHP